MGQSTLREIKENVYNIPGVGREQSDSLETKQREMNILIQEICLTFTWGIENAFHKQS